MINLKVNDRIIEKVRLVIFDKDGTLMNLYHYWSNMVDYRVEFARKRLGFNLKQKSEIMFLMGVDFANERLRNDGPVGIKKREIVMAAMEKALLAIGFVDTHDLCLKAFKEADEISLQHLNEIIRPVNGMKELINFLSKCGCSIALATTDKTQRAKLALDVLGISDKVDIVVGEDMVKNYKPHPDMINFILDKLSVDKVNAVMVGDAITDIEMGNNAKLKASIAVLSGIASKEEFVGKTEYIISDISQITVV
ncbi:MAG: HAD family hydrolase [Candidatus Omnitrophica bacterium]|nr:HAD family hydrolase [Candidatus Omnitrophota bacterium]